MATSITIDNLDDETLQELNVEAQRRGLDLKTAAGELLKEGLTAQMHSRPAVVPSLEALAGMWTDEDAREFRAATAAFEQIDQDLWK